MIIDTPEKFEQLKAGAFDGKFHYIHVTSSATANVLLQPQHFGNSSALSLTFVDEPSDNFVQLFPLEGQGRAVAYFRRGESPLGGLPKNYAIYTVHHAAQAHVTAENVDSILSWTNVYKLIVDAEIAVQLMARGVELNALEGLYGLYVNVNADTFKRLDVAEFIKHLPTLEGIQFTCSQMTTDDVKDFATRNPAPEEWQFSAVGSQPNFQLTYQKSPYFL